MGYIWYLLLQPGRGVIFNLLNQMGHPEWFPNWMSSYTSEIVVLVLVNVWQYAGMTMIIYLAGLQNISQDLYDAAMIDGATGWQSFRFITLPLLVPSIRINVVTNIIGSLSEWRSRLSDGNIKYLHYAYVLRQQNRLFYGSCYDYVLDRSDSCFDFVAPDTHERLITGGG